MFYRHSEKGFAIITVAVDDLRITTINDAILGKIKSDLMERFKMKDQIERDKNLRSISFS